MDNTRTRDAAIAVAYVRVSTSEQHLGPHAQRSTIEAWAERSGVRIAAWHEDLGVGGGSDLNARPGLAHAISDLREHRAGVLVIAKRDRLARDVAVALAVERAVAKQRARIVSADGTANGTEPGDEFMRVVIDGAAQYERALIRARTRAALQAKRKTGFRAGCIPFGFVADSDGRLHSSATERAVIDAVLALREEGLPLRAIVRACHSRGLRSRAGTPLQLTQVARILKNAATAGVHGTSTPAVPAGLRWRRDGAEGTTRNAAIQFYLRLRELAPRRADLVAHDVQRAAMAALRLTDSERRSILTDLAALSTSALPCPHCGTSGPHASNGHHRISRIAYCCAACSKTFRAVDL